MVHDEPVRRLRGAVGPAAWVVSTAAATAVAWWAVSAVGAGGGASGAVLDEAQVRAALAAERAAAATRTATSPTPAPAATPTAPDAPATAPADGPTVVPVVRTWTLDGGVVSATCAGDVVSLVYATPASGWRVDVKEPGPGRRVLVELERDGAEAYVQAVCADGVPQHTVAQDDRRSGDEGDARD